MMDFVENLTKDDSGMKTTQVDLERELECYRNKCKQFEERSMNAEERCMVLELEVEKWKIEFELLDSNFSALQLEKVRVEDELKVLKRSFELKNLKTQVEDKNYGAGGEKRTEKVVDFTEVKGEEDKVIEMVIENKVLECEKKRAESEVDVWKLKYKELESRVLDLERENLVLRVGKSSLAGTMKSQPQMHANFTSKASYSKEGLDVTTSSECLETENNMVDGHKRIHTETILNSTCSLRREIKDLPAAGTPLMDQVSRQTMQAEGKKRGFLFGSEIGCASQVRRQLVFREGSSLSKKMAPSTPSGARPSLGIIDISDSEDELAETNVNTPLIENQMNRRISVSIDSSSGHAMGHENKKTSDDDLRRTLLDQSEEEEMIGNKRNFPFISTPKRKRASNIVTTDSETDEDDDNIPICKLKTKHLLKSNFGASDSCMNNCSVAATVSEEKVQTSITPRRRRRLVALRNCSLKSAPEQLSPSHLNNNGINHSEIPTAEAIDKDEMEVDGSESDTEGESLSGFIVNSPDVSDSGDDSSVSVNVSDDNLDYGGVISRFRRNQGCNLKWEFEADMLAAFGKDLELCMKAVCALYRQQTSEEKVSKGTFYANQRGFSQCDAFRGTTLAEFLTDGDPNGNLNKSVKELEEFDPKGPDLCRALASHYSKQLFAIYSNKEDAFFLPS